MAGAWAVHALLGLVLLPVLLGVMAGIRALAVGLDEDRRGDPTRSRRYVLLADAVALAFLIAFVRQL